LGIDVNENRVTINFNHEKLINTSTETNPTIRQLDKLSVYSVFQRKKHRSKGDGNPLIYAMKGIRGLTIEPIELYKLLPNFYRILEEISREVQPSVIIPVPSSFPFSKTLGVRLSRTESTIICLNDVFQKASNREAIARIDQSAIRNKDINKLNAAIRDLAKYQDMDGDFSMKNVASYLRPAFNPLMIRNIDGIPANTRSITLVDDLLATGTTLKGAASLLKTVLGEDVEINAVCIFSPVKGKL
jgi:hypothetical protein